MCLLVLRWLIRILDHLKCHDQKHERITVKITVSLCLHFFQVHPNGIRKWDGSLRHRGSSFVCAGNCDHTYRVFQKWNFFFLPWSMACKAPANRVWEHLLHDFKQVGPLDSESKAPRYLMECVRASECACGHKRGRNDEGKLLMCTCDWLCVNNETFAMYFAVVLEVSSFGQDVFHL